jgi:glycosyltransferase involved in cell wall biosynthesis
MKLLVALEQRFRKSSQGGYYANGIFNYPFFCRYLAVFDEVLVFARVCRGDEVEPEHYRADGPGVQFIEVPYFIGPIEYIKKYRQIKAVTASAVRQAEAFILRIPGTMGSLVSKQLRKRNIPYGVEVVGDPWDALATCGGRGVLRPFLRAHGYWTMRRQCAGAAVAAYVTERSLQKRYPPGGWSTSYSSVELAGEHLLDEGGLSRRLELMKEPFAGTRPFRVCHVGSMDAMYKAQDTLIEAAALCRGRGVAVEVLFAGDGRYRAVFEQKARELRVTDSVRFLGNLSPVQVRDMLDGVDVFVLPSLTEGLPRVLIEAMARGLPCLASRVGGNGELLHEEFLFAVRDSEWLARAMKRLLSDYEQMCRAAEINLSKAAEYRADRLLLKRNECYQKLRAVCESA